MQRETERKERERAGGELIFFGGTVPLWCGYIVVRILYGCRAVPVCGGRAAGTGVTERVRSVQVVVLKGSYRGQASLHLSIPLD